MNMKPFKPWFWIGTTLSYSYLFYQHAAGINFLLFNVALIASVLVLQPDGRHRRSTVALAAGSVFTAILTAWHPNWATIVMNIVSLASFSVISYSPRGSLVTASVHAVYSLGFSFFRRILGQAPANGYSDREAAVSTVGISANKLLSRSAPLLIVAVFFVLYWQASPAFANLFSNISLDFISLGWVVFTLLGAYWLFAFFYPLTVRSLARADEAATDQLIRRRRRSLPGAAFNPIGLRYEYHAGWLLFVVPNALLLLFNVTDAFYLLTLRLPEGVTYTAFLHQGVNTLIVSIILAIVVVMYFFRDNLNFLQRNQRLRYATYLWIGQNAALVLLTAVKNFNYISTYGLTHKRVGVYVYLLLTIIGLVTTFIKVHSRKSNWFLLRRNAWLFYGVLMAYSSVDWTRAITRYNLNRLNEQPLGVAYLLNMPDANLDMLEEVRQTRHLFSNQDTHIQNRVERFIHQESREGWPSWNYRDHLIRQRLQRN